MDKDRFKKQDELTKKLVDMIEAQEANTIKYKVDGKATGYGLLNNPKVAVQSLIVASNTTFPCHSHKAKEWVILYEGECIVHIGDETIPMYVSDEVIIESNVCHGLETNTGCKLIVIIIPTEEGFPDGA